MGPLLHPTRPTPVLLHHCNASHLWTPLPAAQLQVPRPEEAPGGAGHHLGANPHPQGAGGHEELANNSNFNSNASLPYQVQQPQRSSPPSRSGGVSRAVPIQLASPNLILSAGKQQPPAKDELFPRKKKSEFTM